ncbi:ATP-binding cassette domain-containing protein [Changpingibacter yushuensis]|uniref:ATP-binding cassette domain-containing protein n=1 Tax=Changpingibacter yushuensis TaxID=2758440 RepID=UPI002935249D|nr:ATP-binding cassette domain-containing protein [Changpingibacter yushuensis]
MADEIERMPQGIDTHVGEQGVLISGGQAQRISLARALLSGRHILLLDEPTSQVDIESEERIIQAIRELGPEWTLLMVTHRRALLEIADQTWEMRGGVLSPFVTQVGSAQ